MGRYIKKISSFFLLTVILSLLSSVASASVLENIRFNKLPDKIQIILDLSAASSFREINQSNPPRIVLILPHTKRSSGSRGGVRIGAGAVHGIRTGYGKDGSLVAVIDLKYTARANIYTLPAQQNRGNRIVVDIYHKNSTPSLALESYSANQSPDVVFAGKPIAQKKIAALPLSSLSNATNNGGRTRNSESQVVETQLSPRGYIQSQVPIRNSASRKPHLITIMIDPGHGGKDPGAHNSETGLLEKDVVLQIAKRLKKHIDEKSGFKALLTRDSDIFIPLRERTSIARQHNADLFVSIHADAVRSSQPRGSSVYILSTHGATSQIADYLARTENAVDLKWGVDVGKYDKDVQQTLLYIQQEGTLDSSDILAKRTLQALSKIGRIHKNRVERANFVVLRALEIPSMLVETAFISNAKDARLLASPRYQEKIAQGIADGIQRYFEEHLSQHALLEATQ